MKYILHINSERELELIKHLKKLDFVRFEKADETKDSFQKLSKADISILENIQRGLNEAKASSDGHIKLKNAREAISEI